MRLKYSVKKQYIAIVSFFHACNYHDGRCVNPATEKYAKQCEKIWRAWRKAGGKGKLPVMPPPTVECEKCQYADLTLGSFQGDASTRTIRRHVEGTIPVPLKGRKKVWLDNINQKQLDGLLDEIDPDLEAFAISGSPTIKDFDFLERFPKLKYVYLWWNNKVTHLWDMTKTPDLEFLRLESINRLADVSPLKDAKKLRCLEVWGGYPVESLKPLEYHPSLEFLSWWRMVNETDMHSLITVPHLKYLDVFRNEFEIDAYAMFEAKRPDVDTNFWEGIADYEYDPPKEYQTIDFVGRRQRSVKRDDTVKLEKAKNKYFELKQKYLTLDNE